MKRLEARSSIVVVVDLQERLAAVMPPARLAAVVRATKILVESAQKLGAPVLATQQYTKGLGPTLPELDRLLHRANAERLEKLSFSAVLADGFSDALRRARVTSAIVVGIESHVCVFQTVRDLVDRYVDVHVAVDGVCSRDEQHRDIGLRLCERAGGILTTAESVVFDWLGAAGTEEFREISRLVR